MLSPSPEWRFDDHTGSLRSLSSGFLASVWWRTAERPDGSWVLHAGGWCQGLGAFEVPWVWCGSKQKCLDTLTEAVRSALAADPDKPLMRVQEEARSDLLAKVARLRA